MTMIEIFNDGNVCVLASYPSTPVPGAGEHTVLNVFAEPPDNPTASHEDAVIAVGKLLADPASWPTTPGEWREFGHLMRVTVECKTKVYR